MKTIPLVAAGALIACTSFAVAQCPRDWADGFGIPGNGFNDAVTSFAVYDDGTGPHLYAGGWFTSASGNPAAHVARWNGAAWEDVGGGTNGSRVTCLAVYDDGSGAKLYAGGAFDKAGGNSAMNVARWDGSAWQPLGSGANNIVHAMTVFTDGSGPTLYIGGDFTFVNGNIGSSRIARWNGSWHAMPDGINQTLYTMTVWDDGTGPALYVGGFFSVAGNFVARWNGVKWSTLGVGMDSTVYALAGYDDDGPGPHKSQLYAGGFFFNAGNVFVNRIARWDGAAWSALGPGMNGYVYALHVYDEGEGPRLFVGGDYKSANGVDMVSMARWDGAGFTALGSGLGGSFPWSFALTDFDDGSGSALYCGGTFASAGGKDAACISRWECSAAPCYADCDGSGELDIDDFICFQTLFGLGDAGADCDGSGGLDIDDFICFQTAFGIGCG